MVPSLRHRLFRPSLILCLALAAFLSAGAQAEQIRIEPGPVAAFELTAPSEARAGDAVSLQITARDAGGNIVTNYDRTGGGVVLTAIGATRPASGTGIEPNRFPASAFQNGRLTANVILTRTGATEIEATDNMHRVSSRTPRIDVRAGAVATVKVVAPAQARVGEPFDLVVELYDRHGNAVADYDRVGTEVRLRQGMQGGVGRFDPAQIAPHQFSQGRASVRVRYSAAYKLAARAEAGAAQGRSTSIEVRAGALHTFAVSVPSRRVAAGEPFGIVVEARDAAGNTILDFNRVGGVVEIRSTGSGSLEPSTIPPTAFSQGIAMVTVRYNVAEKIGVVAQDPTGIRRGESVNRVEVVGGRLGRFDIIPAESCRAGEKLAVQVIGYDVYGNMIRDYAERNMRVAVTSADASPLEAPALTAASFVDGIATFAVTPVKAGQLIVQAVDEVSGGGGRSLPVRVRAGVAAAYAVSAPATVVAHEPFEATIVARDRFGNVIEDYNRTGSGVVLEKAGVGDVTPATVPPSAFENGVAKVKFTYNTAEEIVLSVVQQGGTAAGRSAAVLVTHSAPKTFRVDAVARAVAGDAARIKISVLDAYGNPVTAYATMNRSVTLYSENGDPVAPPTIPSSAFNRGVAEIDASFLRTGDVIVVAEEVGGSVIGKSSGIRVVPSRPAQLTVAAPTQAEAGTPVRIRVEMRDRLGNRIRDYSPPAASLEVKILGVAGAAASGAVELQDIRNMVFREGVADISVLPKKAEGISIEVSDAMLRISGRSGPIRIASGPADHFAVASLTQGELRAGEPIRLRITALDAFENVVTNFGEDGSGVRLTARQTTVPATGVLLPSTVSGGAFQQGVASIYAMYNRAEAFDVVVERAAAGTMTRTEVVSAAAVEQSGGSVLSIVANGPLVNGEIRRLTDPLFEILSPGAILATSSPRLTNPGGLASMLTMSEVEEGVVVLIHANAAAVVRSREEANRIVVNVDPVIARVGGAPTPVVVPAPATARPAVPVTTATMADVDRLVRENRFADALVAVKAMLVTQPNDATLLNLRRRLELLSNVVPQSAVPPPVVPVVPPSPMPHFVPLQQPSQPVQTPSGAARAGLPEAEAAVRAGKYRDALSILDGHLAAHPGDQAAQAMKQRVEQLLRILEQSGSRSGR